MATKTKTRKTTGGSTRGSKKGAGRKANAAASDQPIASVHTMAMLSALHVSVWSARRFDRAVTDEVNREKAASKEAGRYNKHLFGGSKEAPSYAKVVAAAGAARTVLYENTLPWSDEGWRLLPTTNWFVCTDKMRAARVVFDGAVATFISEYPTLKEQAKTNLGALYVEADYPSEHDIVSKFGITIEFRPVPQAGDFRLDLPTAQMAEIEKAVTERVEAATVAAMKDAWNRLYESVVRIKERLSDPGNAAEGPSGAAKRASIRDALIENARDTCSALTRLNVTKDAGLNEMIVRVLEEVDGLDAKALRSNESLRREKAKEADAILRQMRGLYGGPEGA